MNSDSIARSIGLNYDAKTETITVRRATAIKIVLVAIAIDTLTLATLFIACHR